MTYCWYWAAISECRCVFWALFWRRSVNQFCFWG